MEMVSMKSRSRFSLLSILMISADHYISSSVPPPLHIIVPSVKYILQKMRVHWPIIDIRILYLSYINFAIGPKLLLTLDFLPTIYWHQHRPKISKISQALI